MDTTPPRTVIAHHLVLTGYGHWLPNDPRGSGSTELRRDPLGELGEIHQGRKRVQPPRGEVRRFYQQAAPLLERETLWFDEAQRGVVGAAFAEVIREQRYTCWACAVLRDHAHLCIRRHRDTGREMWFKLAAAAADRLRLFADIPSNHRVWSERPYSVFLLYARGRSTYDQVHRGQPFQARAAGPALPLCGPVQQLAPAQAEPLSS